LIFKRNIRLTAANPLPTARNIPVCFLGVTLLLALVFSGCSTQRRTQKFLGKQLQYIEEGEQFTGFLMVDAGQGDTLYRWNAGKYFTPASNMKLFTLYAGLKTLPDHIPALKYQVRSDTLLVLGTGDPSALHPVLMDSSAVTFIKSFNRLVVYPGNFQEAAWGAGWAWDDFDRYYMPERSSLPLYGNVLQLVQEEDDLQVIPSFFRDSISPENKPFRRNPGKNLFYYQPSGPDTLTIPLKLDPDLVGMLWESATGVPTEIGDRIPEGPWQELPGIAADSLYREMMTVSDNFLAEQLMLLVSATLGEDLSFQTARDHLLETYLKDMPSPPRWVDGSGLSRYNLCSPESLVYLLMKLYREIPEERLFALMAQGGNRGTLKDWYHTPDGPYLFGKTGSLSNNHNLCGYLKTRSGRTVIFSFMNNHYRKPTTLVKSRMQRILNWVRDNY
jgi:D-alanyl-D-alanine carboxypeptidase/D-alanyl-D-alanine-endopeptidase (penicillin-binding protein 4)